MKTSFSEQQQQRTKKYLQSEEIIIYVPVAFDKFKHFYKMKMFYKIIITYNFDDKYLSLTIDAKSKLKNYKLLKEFTIHYFDKNTYKFYITPVKYAQILKAITSHFKHTVIKNYIPISEHELLDIVNQKTDKSIQRRNGQKESFVGYWHKKIFALTYNYKTKWLTFKNGGIHTEKLMFEVFRESALPIEFPEFNENPEYINSNLIIKRPTKYKSVYKIKLNEEQCIEFIKHLGEFIEPLRKLHCFDIFTVSSISDYINF